MEVPPYVPRLDVLVLGGLLTFENKLWQRVTIWVACAVVGVLPLLFYIVRLPEHTKVRNHLLTLFFELLSWTIINKMTIRTPAQRATITNTHITHPLMRTNRINCLFWDG